MMYYDNYMCLHACVIMVEKNGIYRRANCFEKIFYHYSLDV